VVRVGLLAVWPEPAFGTAGDLRVLAWNRAAEEALGRRGLAPPHRGADLGDVLALPPALAAALRWAVAAGRPLVLPWEDPAGPGILVAAADQGAAPPALVVWREASWAEATLLARARAERLAALGWLVARAAHEIRNPLAAVRGFLDLAARAGAPYLDVVREELGRLEAVAQDLLAIARGPAGPPEPCDLAALLGEVVRLLEPLATRRGVRLALDVPPLPPCLGAPDRLVQAFRNLVENAVDATPPGGVVRVRAQAERGRVRVAVEDQGPGIPPSLRERIFEPFFTTKPGGTGLGLSVVDAVVTAHGGEVAVEEPPEGGARFLVALPVREER
jgi:signal transduction histidine kinase